ncbi:hypothetical protein [Pseudomonas serbica]|uniref:hypothetical protein n=1 Tax=Pseudomonas serbica TaxID=2965074 RepID=UPI00237BB60D|nr:hypothetical protein [Pseudomonas serbica]
MTTDLSLNPRAWTGLQKLQTSITSWCAENQVALGVGEMAAGASLIAIGVSSGAIELGNALVGTSTPLINSEALAGSAAGLGLGAWAGYILGSIGVAAGGTAIGIPAILVIAGASAIFGLAGYAIGDVIHNLITPALQISPLLASGSALAIGTYLLIQGGRRLSAAYGKVAVHDHLPETNHRNMRLYPLVTTIIARTWEELAGFAAELTTLPETPAELALVSSTTLTCGAVGAAIGGAAAASSVTLMGFPFLGGLMMSMGIISAPLWPVVAGAVACGWLGYSTQKAFKHWGRGKNN